MGMKFTNNAATTLAASVAPGDLTLTVNSTKASTFPALSAGDYFYLTLQGLGAFGNIEVVKVTAVAGNTFTITRGQDGTAAQAFTIGDRAELRMCSAILNELPTSATLAASSGSSLVGFLQAGTGAVAETVQSELRQRVSVTQFGAKCDGATNDLPAIQAAIAYLQTVGGGTLYFPGRSLITSTLYLSGAITGGAGYVAPTPDKITFAGNGESGIVSNLAAGDVIRFSDPTTNTALSYMVGFRNFLIDCRNNGVLAINGNSYAGILVGNHYVDIDGLKIVGITGAAGGGIDFGNITDSKVRGITVQGSGTYALFAYRVYKANVRFTDCYAAYCTRAWAIGNLAEAAPIVFGGGAIHCTYSCYWEPTGAFTYSSAGMFVGAFLGETTNGEFIVGAASPGNLDICSLSFIGCMYDNYRPGDPLMTINFGGQFLFQGNNFYTPSSTGPGTIDFGTFAEVIWGWNRGMSIVSNCGALQKNQVQYLTSEGAKGGGAKSMLNFFATGVAAGTANAAMKKDAGTIVEYRMPFAGNIVGLSANASGVPGGTINFQVELNGVGQNIATLTGYPGTTTQPLSIGRVPFAVGDLLRLRYYTLATTAVVDLSAQVVVQF